MAKSKKRLGHFIVIEGTDGSGKGTQVQLLSEKLISMNVPHKVVDFPRYQHNVYGRMVGKYLKGEFGNFEQINPYLVSLTYAGDRLLAKPLLEKWLKQGKLIIANRYVPSNKAHMAAKLPAGKRLSFIKWLDKIEYKVNGIPREELDIFLLVPAKVARKNVDQKGKRQYLGDKKRDIHEENLKYQDTTNKMFLKLSELEKNWKIVDCTKNGEMRIKEEIHQEIMEILEKKGLL